MVARASFALTAGQADDCPQAPALLEADLRPGQRVLANKAYDADYVRDQVRQAGAKAGIQSKKKRNHIERCFNRVKRFRGLASRYEKNASTFMVVGTLGAILIWL